MKYYLGIAVDSRSGLLWPSCRENVNTMSIVEGQWSFSRRDGEYRRGWWRSGQQLPRQRRPDRYGFALGHRLKPISSQRPQCELFCAAHKLGRDLAETEMVAIGAPMAFSELTELRGRRAETGKETSLISVMFTTFMFYAGRSSGYTQTKTRFVPSGTCLWIDRALNKYQAGSESKAK